MHIPTLLSPADAVAQVTDPAFGDPLFCADVTVIDADFCDDNLAQPATYAGLAQRIFEGEPQDGFLRLTLKCGVTELVHHVPGAICGDLAKAFKSPDPIFVVKHGKRGDRLMFLDLTSVASITHEFYRDREDTA